MNVSLGAPFARYPAAAERSPRASAPRYDRTTDDALSSAVATAGADVGGTVGLCVGGAVGLCVGGGDETGLGVTVATATTCAVFCGFAELRTTGVGRGEAVGLGVAVGLGAAVGLTAATTRGDFRASGAAECVGDVMGDGVIGGDAMGVTVIAGDGKPAIVFVSDFDPLPPKKCASAPPRSSPAKITTMISGTSGRPPRPKSSSERRLRGRSVKRRVAPLPRFARPRAGSPRNRGAAR